MAISFDKAFGIHQYTIGARAARAEVLSATSPMQIHRLQGERPRLFCRPATGPVRHREWIFIGNQQ